MRALRPKTFVISLAEAQPRRACVTERLKQAGIAFEFFDAVDGRCFDVESQPIYDGPRRRALYGHDMLGGEIGCLLSHKAILEAVVRRGEGPALVFEDDVALHPYFGRALDVLMENQDRWELVRFLGASKIMRQRQRPLLNLGNGFWMTRLMTQPGGAAAYVVSETGAAKLLKHLDKTPFPIDALMGRPWLTGVDNLMVRPGLADQDATLGSDIGGDRFVSHREIARMASLGCNTTIALRRLVDNVGTRGVYWGAAPVDYVRRRGTS